MDPQNEIRYLKAMEKQAYNGGSGQILVVAVMLLVGFAVAGLVISPPPTADIITYPTEIPTRVQPAFVATPLQLQLTPTLAPTWMATVTPVPTNTPVPSSTAVPTSTPLPTHTLLPTGTATAAPSATATATNTAVPTWTATVQPLPTATRPPVLVAPIQPAANGTAITLLVNDLDGRRQQLWFWGGLLAVLFTLSLVLFVWSLATFGRRPAPETAVFEDPTLPVPIRRQLPPPNWQPKRETRLVPDSQLVQPVQPVAQPVATTPTSGREVEIKLPFDKRLPLTSNQRAYVRTAYLRHLEATKGKGGVNRTAVELWGYKDDIICDHIKDALEEGGIPYPGKRPKSEPTTRPIIINSRSGRKELEA